MKNEALIQPQTLRAARQRAGLDRATLAKRLHIAGGAERLESWEAGAARPTFAQAREVARVLHVPFASLFLDATALGSDEVPDLRTIGARGAFSVDLLDVYRDAQRKVAWARDMRQQRGIEPVPFVGAGQTAKAGDAVREGARAIAELLSLDAEDRKNARDADAYGRLLVARAEDAGVLVLRSSTVGANTHRPLDVAEFRGFAISDELAPLVFINTADAKTAQVFTLIHELAHIWRAETGISQPALDPGDATARDAEAICDAIAAEVLVPGTTLLATWRPKVGLATNADRLRRDFKVSGMVIARRALDLGLVSRESFAPYFAEQMRLARLRPTSTGGPSAAVMMSLRNGAAFTDMVARALRGGEILWRDASRLLGVSAGALGRLIDHEDGLAG